MNLNSLIPSSFTFSQMSLLAGALGFFIGSFKPVGNSIKLLIILGIVLALTHGGAALGQPWQDVLSLLFVGLLAGFVVRLCFYVLGPFFRLFARQLPDELFPILLLAGWLAISCYSERQHRQNHPLAAPRTVTLGTAVEKTINTVISVF